MLYKFRGYIFMKESFLDAIDTERPASLAEKNHLATLKVERKFEELLAEKGGEPEKFVCNSGLEQPCVEEYDYKIADAQRRLEVAEECVRAFVGNDPRGELIARKLQEYWQTQVEVLIRQAELLSNGLKLVSLNIATVGRPDSVATNDEVLEEEKKVV